MLLIYSGAVVGVFLLVASFLELRNEQNYKTVIMKTRLEGYADRVKAYGHDDVSFSEEVRITELSSDGRVIFDSQQPELSEDHSGRPEIAGCAEGHPGWAIRKSDTQGRDYCYLAKKYDDRIIRVAVRLSSIHQSDLMSEELNLSRLMVKLSVTEQELR